MWIGLQALNLIVPIGLPGVRLRTLTNSPYTVQINLGSIGLRYIFSKLQLKLLRKVIDHLGIEMWH